ncbi:IS1595 family transposase [bacterium]|nr:IS1595 family transposase [bacterium]
MEAKSNKLRLDKVARISEDEARETLEKLRWPDGVCCPRCGSLNVYKLEGKSVRKGVYRCKDCRSVKQKDQFTVTVGTIFEDSHIKLSTWLTAISLMCASKKGISAHQIHRMLGITYKSAWFMCHRIRYAMQPDKPERKLKGIIEVDETYIGGKSRRTAKTTGLENKTPVVSLLQRGGKVRSFVVSTVTAATLKEVLNENINPKSHLMTDELESYKKIGKGFASHQTVKHSAYEYSRGNVTTNTVEGFFGLLKRGVNGTFHHLSKEHLHRYLAEFDFRYNRRKLTDSERIKEAIEGFEGKRLTYKKSINN